MSYDYQLSFSSIGLNIVVNAGGCGFEYDKTHYPPIYMIKTYNETVQKIIFKTIKKYTI